MSGYAPEAIRYHLNTFAEVKGEKPFAIDFLDYAIQPAHMPMHANIAKYIVNKLPPAKQKEYLERLSTIKSEYTKGVGLGDGMPMMYAIYSIGSLVNIGFAIFFIVVDILFIFNVLIAMAAFGFQLMALFMHNRVYGNRLGMSKSELAFLCAFLSSAAISIACVIIGALI